METQAVLEAKAVQRYLRKSPRKLRVIANSVRGENVESALNKLKFMNKGAASDIAKVIASAAANIRDKFQDERLENEELFIKRIFIDEAATLKRIQPAPQGRAHQIKKRSSHITVIVAKQEETQE